jgi:hypothetical protein
VIANFLLQAVIQPEIGYTRSMSVTANKKDSHKSWRLRIGLPAILVVVFLLISALGYQII